MSGYIWQGSDGQIGLLTLEGLRLKEEIGTLLLLVSWRFRCKDILFTDSEVQAAFGDIVCDQAVLVFSDA